LRLCGVNDAIADTVSFGGVTLNAGVKAGIASAESDHVAILKRNRTRRTAFL
jgi:hypothetical protein